MKKLLLFFSLFSALVWGVTLKIYSLNMTDEMLYRDIKQKFEALYPNIQLLILRNLDYFALQKKIYTWPRDEDVVITFYSQIAPHKRLFQYIQSIGKGYLAIYSRNRKNPVTLQNLLNQPKIVLPDQHNPVGLATAYALYNYYRSRETLMALYKKCPIFPYSAIDVVKMVKYRPDITAGISWFPYSKWKRYGFYKLNAFFIPTKYYRPPVLVAAINPNPDMMLPKKLTLEERTAKFEAAKTFIDFLISPQGQRILRKWGF
ncbi:MAG: hypothetical protein C6I01_03695 [Epsilonproteobacteria bacterium]|nr:hypothetical protein [Campylobacterota bacterium]NPA89086.1 ABC transporter substrate-binding protein [Campylobacterota bacterium]